jgi:hypothetical protein
VEFGGKNEKNGGFPLRKLVDLEWKHEKPMDCHHIFHLKNAGIKSFPT